VIFFILRNFKRVCELNPNYKIDAETSFRTYVNNMKTTVASKTMNLTVGISQFQTLIDKYQTLVNQFQNNPLFQIFQTQLTTFENNYLTAYTNGQLDDDYCQCPDFFTLPLGYIDVGAVGSRYSDLQTNRLNTLLAYCANPTNCPAATQNQTPNATPNTAPVNNPTSNTAPVNNPTPNTAPVNNPTPIVPITPIGNSTLTDVLDEENLDEEIY